MEEIPIEKVAIDSQVEVISNGICYRGTVVNLDSVGEKITLKEVQMVKDDKVVPAVGQLRFFREEIESMKFVDEEAVLRKMDPFYLLMKPFRKPTHLRGQNVPTDEDILKMGRPTPEEMTKDSDDVPGGACWSSSVISHVVDQMDENFTSTISLLKEHKAVAVAAQGVLLSRQGELCWLAIGTPTHIYLFDILGLGDRAFTEGLTDILQSSRIMKIMHDCRFLSDYLFHKHEIFLQNIFDTQVARVVNYKQHHFGDLPRFVDSLPKTLQDVLGVDPNKFPSLWYRSYALEKDQSIWRQRPLSDDLQKVLEAQVVYLFDLRNALLEKIMLELNIGVDTYLKVVRDAKNSEVDSMVKSSFLLPADFQKAADFAKERYAEARKTSEIDPLTGYRESMGRLSYWKVRFSRDAWHGQQRSNDAKEEEIEEPETIE